jgi:D-arginine dehydrogenase
MTSITCDVAVIGGGMAGASVAAELADHGTVVLVEAEHALGAHSTGRSAASYLPSYGGQVVRQLTVASRPLFDAWSERLEIGLLHPRPLLWLATDADSERANHSRLQADATLQSLTPTEAMSLCPALEGDAIVSALLDSSAMDIDVASLHQAYVSELKRRKGTVVMNARVTGVQRAGSTWTVTAGDHRIQCATVVNAAGAWVDEVAQSASVPCIGVRPKRRTAFVSRPKFGAELGSWALVIDACERWYFKPEGGAVLASPAEESESTPCDARPDELAIARAIEAINEVTKLGIRSVDHAWAGLRSFVPDRSPVVGAWNDHEGFVFLAGQGGYGIQMAPALANVAADIATEGFISEARADYGVSVEELSPQRLATV